MLHGWLPAAAPRARARRPRERSVLAVRIARRRTAN
jgi:hypothetical protein